MFFFFSSRRRHTRFDCDWSSDVCSSHRLVAHGVVGKPTQHDLQRRQPTRLTVFGDGNSLSEDLLKDCSDRPTPFGASLRIAALAWLPARRQRGVTFAGLIVAGMLLD